MAWLLLAALSQVNREQEAEPRHSTNMKSGRRKKAIAAIVDKIFLAVVKEKSLIKMRLRILC